MQSADDALMPILRKLDTFRGESRFTTWAAKFAILEAATKARRRAWQHREVTLAPDDWQLHVAADEPQTDGEHAELLNVIGTAIGKPLTTHQREVLVAITLNDVPIDVLADRLGTTRARSTRRSTTPAGTSATNSFPRRSHDQATADPSSARPRRPGARV